MSNLTSSWRVELKFVTTGGELTYDHNVYSPYKVEDLKKMGLIVEEE